MKRVSKNTLKKRRQRKNIKQDADCLAAAMEKDRQRKLVQRAAKREEIKNTINKSARNEKVSGQN